MSEEQDHLDKYCEYCGSSMSYEKCWSCGGEGVHYLYEEDPLLYVPGNTRLCTDCDSYGGYWACFNSLCPGKMQSEGHDE